MPHDFGPMMDTLTRSGDGLAEPVVLEDGDGVQVTRDAVVLRDPVQAQPETDGGTAPRFVVLLTDDADLGVTASAFDAGTYKVQFADRRGGTALWHDIARARARRGQVRLEITGAGYAR